MTTTFWGKSLDGKLSLCTEDNAIRFRNFLRKNPNIRIKIDPYTPESDKQRGFFEGAVVKLICYYQTGLDYHSSRDCKEVREWLKREFNGEFKVIGGQSIKIAKSTRGELNRGFLERVLDWMNEQGYQIDLLNPSEYKKWRDEVFPFGDFDCYICYLSSLGKLKK